MAFDGNEYRKTVLKALDADFSRADPETGDVFYVLALDPALDAEADDDAAITVRLDEIVAFWQKQRSAPKFRDTAEALVRRKDAYREVMTDPSRRREARGRVLAQRSRADTDRMARLDETADRLEKSYGGIPADRVERLRAMAAREDVDATAFTAWLARRRVLGTLDDAAAPSWDPSVRHQIRTTLNRAARVTGDAATFATLFSFLGLTPEASVATLRRRHDEFFAELDQARHNRIRTLIADLLAQVKTRLAVDGGPAAYRASLIADAADEISSGVEDAGIVSGQVDAREYDALVARIVGLGWGIPTPDARGVVRRVAAAQGVAVEVSTDGASDYVLCGSCRMPQPDPGTGTAAMCRHCGQPLFVPCPACGAPVSSASAVCGACGSVLAEHRAAAEALRAARALLDEGRPVAAREALRPMAPSGGVAREHAALAGEVDAVIARAHDQWRALDADRSARRVFGAHGRAQWLVRSARDVDSPAGSDPQTVLEDLATRRDELQQRVRSAVASAATDPTGAEAALTAVLTDAVDCAPAETALAAMPLPPPTDLVATPSADAVTVSWVRAAVPGSGVLYRVKRHGPGGESTTLGRTSATSFEDAGAPAGSAVHYEVSAVAGRRSSPPARSGVCRVVKDLAGLRAEVEVVTDGRARASDGQVVVLTWPPLGGVAEVVVDRTVRAGDDGEDAVTRATRRFRRRDASDLVDDGCEIGVRYAYRAWVEYPGDAGQVTRTPGRTVEVTLTERPRPVRELWAATGDDGATTVSFGAARAGEVRVYASPPGSPWSPGTEDVSLADLDRAASGARVRLVGAGRRRVVDRAGRGAVHYTSVTVVGDRARPGAQLDHQAVGRPTDLAVRPGPGAGEVLLTFELPAGVTEAMVCWRVGESPSGPEDPLAAGGRVTNTKLQIDGGYTVALPPGPDAVLATVYPMVRPAGGRPVAVGQGATVTLRESGAGRVGGAAVSWELRRPTNPFRRTFRVVVRSRSDGGVPGIAVVAAPGTSAPTSLEAGHLMGRAVAGEGRETTVTVDGRALPAATSALAVFLVDGDGRPLHPPGTVEPPADPTITV